MWACAICKWRQNSHSQSINKSFCFFTYSIAGKKIWTPVSRAAIFLQIIDAVDAHRQRGLFTLQCEALIVLTCKMHNTFL